MSRSSDRGHRPARLIALLVTLVGALVAAGGASAIDGVNGYQATPYATGFSTANNMGPIGLAFDGSGNLYASQFWWNQLYRFAPGGGVANASTALPTLIEPSWGASGLAFAGGRLYLAEQQTGRVIEVDTTTGAEVRTIAHVPCATALATDPTTGDLLTTSVGCTGVTAYRLSNFASGPATVTNYSSIEGEALDGLAFAPDGTLYGAVLDAAVVQLSQDGSSTPGPIEEVADVDGADGMGVVVTPNGRFIFVNSNDGFVDRVDLSTDPATVTRVAENGSRGDFATIGPDGCLFVTQTDSIWRISNADGSCNLAPAPKPVAVATAINCAPSSGTYGFASVGATLTSAGGPIANAALVFALGGQTLNATTAGDGSASATPATALGSGTYTVSYAGSPTTLPSTATCSLTVSNSGSGKVTGGPSTANGGKGGFNAQADRKGLKGDLEFHVGAQNVHAGTVTSLGVAPDGRKAWFGGALDDGRSFTAYVEDNGEPGRSDVFRLWVAGAELTPGQVAITGGNIQIHT
jgi:sugar lactone lactonase YvrE